MFPRAPPQGVRGCAGYFGSHRGGDALPAL